MFILSTGREQLLTEHALVWNKRKIIRMPVVLAKRYIQVSVVHSVVSNTLYIIYLFIYLLCHIEYIVYIEYEKNMHDQYVAGLNHNS